MPRIAVVNTMSTTAPPKRDEHQQRVDFSSHVLTKDGVVDEGKVTVENGNDSGHPNVGFTGSGDGSGGKDGPSVSVPQTPAPLPPNSSETPTNKDSAMPISTVFTRFGPLPTNTPGNFASVGQTPMTGASLGSINPTPRSTMTGNGILKSSNYKTVTDNALNTDTAAMNAGISAIGLTRGNNPLGPTPLVRRNDAGKSNQQQPQQQYPTPSPGMHYHFPVASNIQTFDTLPPPKKRGLSSIEEEDPAMLRYASTAGSDQSPLVARTEAVGKKELEKVEETRAPAMLPQTLPDGILRDPRANNAPPRDQQIQPSSGVMAPAALSEFPFYFDGYASWICRHCSHISPYYRGENYIWHFPQAPPNEFVDIHLVVCPGLNQAPRPQQFHPSAPPKSGYSGQTQKEFSQDEKKAEAPDPPTGRTPPPAVSAKTGTQQYLPGRGHPFQGTQPPYGMIPSQQLGSQPHFMMPPHRQKPPFPFGLSGTVDPSPARAKRKSTGKNVSPKGRPSDDMTYTKAIEHLEDAYHHMPDLTQPNTDIGSSLVEMSDSELITDYFYHIMKQLVVCRFAEKDRKTRGGKRENVNVGYGGLQCRHCIYAPSSRKFFWSNVDRLANSFAEIPTHVLKCKSTPEDVKDSLLVLKGRHPEQMQMLARGSQKVFFRRMWRRLHDGDASGGATPISQKPSCDGSDTSNLSDNASKSSNTQSHPARPLADTLAAESTKTVSHHDAALSLAQPDNTGSSKCVLLAIPEDKDWLSDDQCFVRNNIEVFAATTNDCKVAVEERKYPIKLGWIGIRCLHCAKTPDGARGAAVCYPYSISSIYESVREFQRLHFEKCENLPPDIVEASQSVNKASTTLSSVLRRYYVQSARALGLMDNPDGGIKAGAKPETMSRAGLTASPANSLGTSSHISANLEDPANLLLEMSRKRKAYPDPACEVYSPTKKQYVNDDIMAKQKV